MQTTTKKLIYNTLEQNALLYILETWTINRHKPNKLLSNEMRFGGRRQENREHVSSEHNHIMEITISEEKILKIIQEKRLRFCNVLTKKDHKQQNFWTKVKMAYKGQTDNGKTSRAFDKWSEKKYEPT